MSIEYNIDPIMEDKVGESSLRRIPLGQHNSRWRGVNIVQQSIEGGVDYEPNMPQGENKMTSQMRPSHLQFYPCPSQIAILLLDSNHCANSKVGKNDVETPLCQLIEGEHFLQGDCVGVIQSLTRV